MKIKCARCNNIAQWLYMPNSTYDSFCDKCIPRGCSCMGENEPCCEYDFCEFGIDDEDDEDEE